LDDLFDLLDFRRDLYKSFIDVSGILRRRLDIRDLNIIRKFFGCLISDLSFVFEIAFVSDQKLIHVFASIPFDFLQPLLDVVVRDLVGNIKYDNNSVRASVVRRSNGTETFLTSGIPNLKLDGFAIKLNRSNFEVNTNCADVAFRVRVVGKTEKKTKEKVLAIKKTDKRK